MTALRLEAPNLSPLVISEDNGYIIRRFDLGAPDIRVVSQDAPDADGTIDTTSHIGARTVGLQCRIARHATPSIELALNRLKAFAHPRIRATAYYTRDDGIERRIGLRAGPYSAPWESPFVSDITMQWVAPLGISETAGDPQTALATASGTSTVGRTYPLTFPRVYPGSSPGGQTIVTNGGTIDAYPLIRLYGPAGSGVGTDDIVLRNITQGKDIVLSGLTIAAGEFVELDTRAKTVFYLGLPTDSRYPSWNFARSDWWTLSPGDNDIRYVPETFTAPANAVIEWRDAWI